MTHSIKDQELKELLRAKRLFKEAWEIVDTVIYTKYIKLAKKKIERRVNGERRQDGKT